MSEKMEIELTSAQAEKVEILKENGITIGDAIDMLLKLKMHSNCKMKLLSTLNLTMLKNKKRNCKNKSISLMRKFPYLQS